MKVVKKNSNINFTQVKKRPRGRTKIFDEIKTYGFTLPPVYREILAFAAKQNQTSASELIRQWIDREFRDHYESHLKK